LAGVKPVSWASSPTLRSPPRSKFSSDSRVGSDSAWKYDATFSRASLGRSCMRTQKWFDKAPIMPDSPGGACAFALSCA
jgi:hypothetical protein